MNNDFVNKALESARALQQTVADAATKGAEQAKPLVADAMARAQDLQKTIVEQAPQYGEAAQAHLQTAKGHLDDVHQHGPGRPREGRRGRASQPDAAGRERPASGSPSREGRYRGDGTETAGSAGRLGADDRQPGREVHETCRPRRASRSAALRRAASRSPRGALRAARRAGPPLRRRARADAVRSARGARSVPLRSRGRTLRRRSCPRPRCARPGRGSRPNRPSCTRTRARRRLRRRAARRCCARRTARRPCRVMNAAPPRAP